MLGFSGARHVAFQSCMCFLIFVTVFSVIFQWPFNHTLTMILSVCWTFELLHLADVSNPIIVQKRLRMTLKIANY